MYRLISGSTQAPGHVEAELNHELQQDVKGRAQH
ncbi:RND multidrug efflux transporter [Vibrio cholerae]|nr:RND multidrug efflux transporter [Vibrio cholerae]